VFWIKDIRYIYINEVYRETSPTAHRKVDVIEMKESHIV